jgi:hypothetical protein
MNAIERLMGRQVESRVIAGFEPGKNPQRAVPEERPSRGRQQPAQRRQEHRRRQEQQPRRQEQRRPEHRATTPQPQPQRPAPRAEPVTSQPTQQRRRNPQTPALFAKSS